MQTVRFQGFSKPTYPPLKHLKAGDVLNLTVSLYDASQNKALTKTEAVTLIGIEGHHGKSFNPQTLQETDRKAPMRNDFSFPVDSVSMQHCCIDSELDLVDLVKLRTAQGKELALLYGKFSPFGRSPLKIHQTRLSRNQGSAPISIDIALSKNQLKLDEENPQYKRAFDYSTKQRRFWGAFSLVVQLLGGNFSRY